MKPTIPEGALPWLPPSGLGASCLAALDRPPAAWVDTFYGSYDPDEDDLAEAYTPAWVRKLRAAGRRPQWRMERLWLPDAESEPEDVATYEQACRKIEGEWFPPSCLDYYAARANDHWPAEDDDGVPDWEAAIEWAAAGVMVLQASLPYPFIDVLPYAELDNRPAHRVLGSYAFVLSARHPRKALPWLRALVFANPADNLGARYALRGAAREQ